MAQAQEVLLMMGRVIMETFTSPLFILLFVLIFAMVAWQYKRMEDLSYRLVKVKRRKYLLSAFVSTISGLLGGMLGSILLVLVGIDLNNIGIMQLWVLALLLMFINPRFLCFAYAGGILSLYSLITGFIEINVAQLLALVAVLHLVESILILVNGHFLAVPLYVCKNEDTQGAFNLQKFWPIPLIALVSMGYSSASGGVAMPEWWPLLRDYTGFAGDQTYALLPVLAILGYGDISTTGTPWARARQSSLNLLAFSLILLALAILASRYRFLLPAAALFSPLGHELVIWLGMREESNKLAIYKKVPGALKVLDVVSGSPAWQAGILTMDLIVAINGVNAENKQLLSNIHPGENELKISRQGRILNCRLTLKTGQATGIIPVPELQDPYLEIKGDTLFDLARRVWRRIKRFLKLTL